MTQLSYSKNSGLITNFLILKPRNIIGPSALVTAAFIGPGTLTVCSIAGVRFGYELIWVLLFATIATIILQGMSARLGMVSGLGLGEALRKTLKNPWVKVLGLGLVFIAIIIGNAAYEMGNITGAVLGLEFIGANHHQWGPILLGIIASIILWSGNIQTIQKVMGVMVVIMSLIFISSAIMAGSFSELFRGMVPALNSENQLTALGLIGTTIVPYNLFLHASACSDLSKESTLRDLNIETILTISVGGLISICVLVTAASGPGGIVKGISDMSVQLEPLLGSFAKPFLSVGIFAAGISSALTAPLAAALTAKGIFAWKDEWKSRIVWGSILLLGVVFSMLGFKPISVIQVAQIANGLLLPIIVVFLIVICNKSELMGQNRNSILQNILGILVLFVSLVISFRSFNSVFHFL